MRDDSEDAKRRHDLETEAGTAANKAATEAAIHALKAFMLINAGSAIAMLTFAGRLVSLDNVEFEASLEPLIKSLLWFAWGVALSAAALGFVYCTHFSAAGVSMFKKRTWTHPYLEKSKASKFWYMAAITFQVLAAVTGFMSLVFFVLGFHDVAEAIQEFRLG